MVPSTSGAVADTYLSSMPFCRRMLCSSRAVWGPCSFCPFSISFSSCSMDCEENRTGGWKWERRIVSVRLRVGGSDERWKVIEERKATNVYNSLMFVLKRHLKPGSSLP